MKTYKVKTINKEYMLKTSKPLSFVKTSPALFFLTNGEYQIQECGRLKSIKKLFKTVRINNV